MSFENKGTTPVTVIVTSDADGTGNFVFRAGVDDPAVTIEAAWTYLAQFGGGRLVTKGAGETWIVETQIDSQCNNVKWVSDWSLTIQAMDALDADVLQITHDDIEIIDISIDGNESSGVWGVGGYHGIHVFGGTHVKIIRPKIIEAHEHGIHANECVDLEIVGGRLLGCRYNLVNIGANNVDAWIHDNYCAEASDVGITVNCILADQTYDILIENNIIENIDNNEAVANSHWGLGAEGTGVSNVEFRNNTVKGCPARGFSTSNAAMSNIRVNDNTFRNCGTAAGGGGIRFRAPVTIIEVNDNRLIDCGYDTGGTGILLQGDDFTCNDNTVIQSHAVTGTCSALEIDGEDGEASDNLINYSGTGGTQYGFRLIATQRVVFGNNKVYNCATYGYRLQGNTDDNEIIGGIINSCGTGIASEGASDAEDNVIRGVYFQSCTTGINLIAGMIRTDLSGGNHFIDCTTCLTDNGTDTILPLKPFQFTDVTGGSAIVQVASPTGCYVSDANGTAIAWGQLPVETHQVVRLKVWAISKDAPVNAGGQMHCEFTFNAGASNAAYNEAAKSWNVVNKDSEEADYIADDVIHWILTDADTGDSEVSALVAGDSFEILAIYESAADPDGDTDAKFRVVEVEYV